MKYSNKKWFIQFRKVATFVELIQYKHEWPSVNWNGSMSKWQTIQLTVLWFSDLTQMVQSSVNGSSYRQIVNRKPQWFSIASIYSPLMLSAETKTLRHEFTENTIHLVPFSAFNLLQRWWHIFKRPRNETNWQILHFFCSSSSSSSNWNIYYLFRFFLLIE